MSTPATDRPWHALWALVLGFFMILVDSTIVTVATPALRADLDASYNAVIWVTSAYLLAYVIPLLVTGRLGDRIGPKKVYLTGLTIFTLASLWCGLTDTIEMLIVARVAQGLGASMMTPQTMTVVTRTFSPRNRGRAMSLWGATAGAAMLVGPVLGGVIVEHIGWQWIFLVNIPVGIIGLILAWLWVPNLETHSHTFDWLGVFLSLVAVSLLTFGIQEGETYNWGRINQWLSVPLLLGLGVVFLALFVFWQSRNKREPLVPLTLFADRNFAINSTAVAAVSFTVLAFPFPFMLWAQQAKGWSPAVSGMLIVPMAVLSIALADPVGRMIDRGDPKKLTIMGFAISVVAMTLMALAIRANVGYVTMLGVVALLGLGNAFLWSPLSTNAVFNLPMSLAGAGSGVYNTMRQFGSVIGSAAIAAAITSRVAAHLPEFQGITSESSDLALPAEHADAFSVAMSEALYLVIAAYLVGLTLVLFIKPRPPRDSKPHPASH